MSKPEPSHALDYQRIRANPKFQQLVRSRSRLAWTLSWTTITPIWRRHAPLGEGRALTIGIPVAAAVIVFSWLLTGWYVRSANTRFDALSKELLEDLQ